MQDHSARPAHSPRPPLHVESSHDHAPTANTVTWQEQAHLLDLAHVFIRGLDGTILFWNAGSEQMYGYAREEALGQVSHRLLRTEFPRPLEQIQADLLETGEWEGEVVHRTKGGERLVIAAHWVLHRDEGGSPHAILEVNTDVTESKRIEEERRYVMAGARCLLWYSEIEETGCKYLRWVTRIPDVEAAQQFVPLDVRKGETYMAAWYRARLPEDRDRSDEIGTAAVRAGRSYEQEFRCVDAHGRLRWLHEDIRVETIEPGQRWRAIGVSTDITERRAAEEALRQRQAEVEQLNLRLRRAMAETHHRVKNNLQVISALVDMQAMESEDTERVGDLRRLGRHIRSLAAIHDLLTRESKGEAEVETISTRAAVQQLLPVLLPEPVGGVAIAVDDVRLPARQGTAVAILINELVSNARKHGGGLAGISMRVEDGLVRLEIADNGPGFPPRFDARAAANTGLELVESLATWDLSGSVAYENRPEGGGRVAVTFPVVEPTPV